LYVHNVPVTDEGSLEVGKTKQNKDKIEEETRVEGSMENRTGGRE
jgi:hypothetical protein